MNELEIAFTVALHHAGFMILISACLFILRVPHECLLSVVLVSYFSESHFFYFESIKIKFNSLANGAFELTNMASYMSSRKHKLCVCAVKSFDRYLFNQT